MVMPTMNPNMIDIKNMTESDRFLLLYQGWRDTWKELTDYKEDNSREVTALKGDVGVHQKLLITGDGNTPSHIEQLRTHQKFIDTAGKIIWIFVSAVVVQIVSFGFIAAWTVARLYPVLERIGNP